MGIRTQLLFSSIKATLLKWHKAWVDEEKSDRITLVFLCVFGAGLRGAYLFQPMRYDEAFTYTNFISSSLSIGLSWYPYPNNHLFNTFLAHISTGIFGNQPWAIRLPAFIAGVLIIPCTYIVIKKLYNKHIALIATALVVSSSQLIDFSTQSRGYTIQVLAFLVLILFSLKIIATDSLFAWIGFVVSAVVGFYSIPTMLYFFPPVLVWTLMSGLYGDRNLKERVLVVKGLASCAAVALFAALLYLPVVFRSGFSSLVFNYYIQPLNWGNFISGLPGNIKNLWSGWNIIIPLPFALLLLLGFVVSVLFHKRISASRINLNLMIIVWCIFLLFVQRVLPFPRIWMPLIPLYMGGAAAGLYLIYQQVLVLINKKSSIRKKAKPVLANLLIIFVSLFIAGLVVVGQTPFQRDDLGKQSIGTLRDAESITLFLKDRLSPGDAVYAHWAACPSLEYYFRKYKVPVEYLITTKLDSGETERTYFVIVGMEVSADDSMIEYMSHIEGLEASLIEQNPDGNLKTQILRESDYYQILEFKTKK